MDNPLKRGIASLKSGSSKINGSYSASASRTLHLAGISGAGNILLGLGKILSGILSLSAFVCANGLWGWCWRATVRWLAQSGRRMRSSSLSTTAGQA